MTAEDIFAELTIPHCLVCGGTTNCQDCPPEVLRGHAEGCLLAKLEAKLVAARSCYRCGNQLFDGHWSAICHKPACMYPGFPPVPEENYIRDTEESIDRD